MRELVRLRMRPSRDRKSFRYMLDYVDQNGKRRQVSLGHADKRQAERQRYEKELELRVNVADPVSMKLTDFFRDSLARTKGQVRATTLKETARSMNDFASCVGDIDVQEVQYRHGEQFIQYCSEQDISAATVAKKVKHRKRVFQLAEDRGNWIAVLFASSSRPKFLAGRFACSRSMNATDCVWPPGITRRMAGPSNGSCSFACAWSPVCGGEN